MKAIDLRVLRICEFMTRKEYLGQMKQPIIEITRDVRSDFLVLNISCGGESWSYNISQKSIEVEGWGPIVDKIINRIIHNTDGDGPRHEIACLVAAELDRILPRDRPHSTHVPIKLVKKPEPEPEPEPKPPKTIVEYTPLPLARVYRQQAFQNVRLFFRWLRKIIKL